MRIPLVLLLLFFSISSHSQQKKQLQFFQTDWGRSVSWDAFCERAKASGYDGIEIWYPHDSDDQKELKTALEKYGLAVGFLNGTDKSLSFEQSLRAYTENFKPIIAWHP